MVLQMMKLLINRNTSAFDDVDLVPNVLRGVENVDLSTTIFGKKLDLPFYLAPTALQRFFIMMEKEQLEKLQKNLILCLVFQL